MTKISKKQLEILQEIVENCGARFDDDYSGRAMMGEKCIAIRYYNSDEIANICEMLNEQGQKKLSFDIALRWKTDQMGKGFVRYNR